MGCSVGTCGPWRTLEDGVVELLITDQHPAHASGDLAPISRNALLKVLHRSHQVELKRQLSSTMWRRRLEDWAAKDAAAPQT